MINFKWLVGYKKGYQVEQTARCPKSIFAAYNILNRFTEKQSLFFGNNLAFVIMFDASFLIKIGKKRKKVIVG